MKSTIVRQLVLKDLYLNRPIIGGAFLVGGLSLVMASTGPTGYAFGSITFLMTLIAMGMVLAMYSVAQERKDRSDLFVLSLPLSGADYARAKVIGAASSFLPPWAAITAGAVALIGTSTRIPHGLLPIMLLISGYTLTAFCILIAIVLLMKSDSRVVFSVILVNFSCTFFCFAVAAIPSVGNSMRAPEAVWSPTVFAVLACEMFVAATALALPVAAYGRKKDLI